SFSLPRISTSRDSVRGETAGCGGGGVHGFSTLKVAAPGTLGRKDKFSSGVGAAAVAVAATNANEVETNPPYCPFRVDAWVNIYAFEEGGGSGSQIHLQGAQDDAWLTFKASGHAYADTQEEKWLSWGALPATIKLNERSQVDGQQVTRRAGALEDDT
ncbi:hypothetical protein LTR02_018008, partial [Friedmanniomyces endolithicus]